MKANGADSAASVLIENHFNRDAVAIQLRAAGQTVFKDNTFVACEVELQLTGTEEPSELRPTEASAWRPPDYPVHGTTRPVAARTGLRGRHKILITEWGPYDWSGPLLWPTSLQGASHVYQLLGDPAVEGEPKIGGEVTVTTEGERLPILTVRPRNSGVTPYRLRLRAEVEELEVEGVIIQAQWDVRLFPWTIDPREDADGWRAEADDTPVLSLPALDFSFGAGDGQPRDDRFGTLAETRLRFPAGEWELVTLSDDGIRVWTDGELLIDDWTHHGTTEHRVTLDLSAEREVALRVEHFELDGAARLSLAIERKRQ